MAISSAYPELAANLLELLGEPAFVELTVMVGTENLRSRVNSALGLRSQGLRIAARSLR